MKMGMVTGTEACIASYRDSEDAKNGDVNATRALRYK